MFLRKKKTAPNWHFFPFALQGFNRFPLAFYRVFTGFRGMCSVAPRVTLYIRMRLKKTDVIDHDRFEARWIALREKGAVGNIIMINQIERTKQNCI